MSKTRKLSPWNAHVNKVKAEMTKSGEFKKGDNLSKVLKHASKTWKTKKGGDDSAPAPSTDTAPVPAAGRRRRSGKKTRRVKKH